MGHGRYPKNGRLGGSGHDLGRSRTPSTALGTGVEPGSASAAPKLLTLDSIMKAYVYTIYKRFYGLNDPTN